MTDLAEKLRKTHGKDIVVISERAFRMITERYNLACIFGKQFDNDYSEQATRVHLGQVEVQNSHGLSWYLGPKPPADENPTP